MPTVTQPWASPWATVVIPTRQSAAWLPTLLAHYQARGVMPALLIDSRTDDRTRQIADAFGARRAEIGRFTVTEAVVARAGSVARTPWVLFVHDDEIPSDGLFGRLAGPPPPDQVQSVAVPRRWAWYEPGTRLRYGRSSHWSDRAGDNGADHHWRLFRPDRVIYVAAMHSDGFRIDRWARLAASQYLVHFEWVIRSSTQREAKLRRYDEARRGYGRFFQNMYLPESQPQGVIDYRAFETDAFDELARVYHAQRDAQAHVPRRSLRVGLAELRDAARARLGLVPPLGAVPADRRGLEILPQNEHPDTAPPCHLPGQAANPD